MTTPKETNNHLVIDNMEINIYNMTKMEFRVTERTPVNYRGTKYKFQLNFGKHMNKGGRCLKK